jgi:isoleucyl-tRNA synthetase
MPNDYNATLNLPKTGFPMRASLPQKEPEMVDRWYNDRLYWRMVDNNKGKPFFIFHDGPPYANASIHLGTALNKVLKDIIVRSKNMMGFCAPYIPGWDTHGLPIELKALASIGIDKQVDVVELRRHCKQYAQKHIEIQMGQFKRLGTLADYENPYVTYAKKFEAKQIEVFGAMAEKGYIYKGLKPVHWCPDCITALAEAEIEYLEEPNTSIYVKFPVINDKGLFTAAGADLSKTYVVIWTTTNWTLPGNVANCVGPKYIYSLVSANGEYYILAQELVKSAMQAAGINVYEELATFPGTELEGAVCRHPLMDRESFIILGDHVTLETGTGIVHTSPGHGLEDFEVCVNHYPHLPIYVPVDDYGMMNELAGQYEGLSTEQAGRKIFEDLKSSEMLFAFEEITHQYPHCWRCKKPVLFRATEQWFCSIEKFRDKVIEAVRGVTWIPEWGEERMASMVNDRSDWCISRQRSWGVPIPIFYCQKCRSELITKQSIQAVADLFRREGSDAWFIKTAEEILPKSTKCAGCGYDKFTKETDIMDVWFDSGVSHAAVLDTDKDNHWPCDLYLEGADQYRGWFQSSLLTAVAWRGQAPYKSVCSHGWVVDGEGRKMSKSLNNGMEPEEITDQFGADILRLWVASSDYHSDIRLSMDILKQLAEIYRKIRNTARFILGNLYDFAPDSDSVAPEDLTEIDRWALEKLDELTEKVQRSYEKYEFYAIFHAVHNFCAVDMSNFYLDVLKDRLYVEAANSPSRRAAQTAIYKILRQLNLLIAPIIPFTAEEIWSYMPPSKDYIKEFVALNQMGRPARASRDEMLMSRWNRIHRLRDAVNKALEAARANKSIGKSLEARVVLGAKGELYDFLVSAADLLPMTFIVSQAEVTDKITSPSEDFEGLSIEILPAQGSKCVRCWMHTTTVGSDKNHPNLCARCAGVVG